MKLDKKKLWWAFGVIWGCGLLVFVSQPKEEKPWKMGDPLDARYWKMVTEASQRDYQRQQAQQQAARERYRTPEAAIERIESKLSDMEHKQRMERLGVRLY